MHAAGERWRAWVVVAGAAATLGLGGLAATALAPARPATLAAAAAAEPAPAGAAAPAVAEESPGPPRRLSETGLYLPDGSVDPRNRPFLPQYPLWSDGAVKRRWISLPEGATIDVSDVDVWRFPPGTTLWKEFAWGGHRVETRMLRLSESGEWTYATYVWTEDQGDAVLAPERGLARAFEFAPGQWHAIPGVADCVTCHGSSPSGVLGFSALQLSDDRDPMAPHGEPLPAGAVTLGALVAEDRLRPPRPDLVTHPPRIRERDPVARAALGYLSANCGGCHNDRGPLARLGLVLLHDAGGEASAPEPAIVTALDAPGRYVPPGIAPNDSRLVAPGAPERSALLYRMSSRRPAAQMPPLGTAVADDEAVGLVRRWIESLAVGPPS